MRNEIVRFMRRTTDCRFCGERAVRLLRNGAASLRTETVVDYFCTDCARIAAAHDWTAHSNVEAEEIRV